MRDEQTLHITGEVRRVDKRDTQYGTRALSLSVLVKEKTGIAWFRCTAFGELAKEIEESRPERGQRISVSGRLLPGTDGNPKTWVRGAKTYSNYELRISTYTLGEKNVQQEDDITSE